ncbi:A/G-specific adenine glycosylase [Staphylococcus lutrae]|uniref:Adenine DNA glycosylase n=1 Tax=Staphylococcus lutrae TaxID=155085 RepID=A0AAC9RSV7_9STAP|nr:A/G-specific adenine glycosylase [Staphylococcus lutrae]ARJ50135.1 A/G-specific adenine glycosylase [Staphylococcus lutrae]PNZ38065.1 A/G-specific adenine glycosylase [Staphylococcus lutrae]
MLNETTFKSHLLTWFEAAQRQMPWRETKNPYYIWISEVMLQQTQVDTVRDYYLRFIEAYPTIHDLAKAKEEEVLKLWEGLGYYSRARHFHTAAKEVVAQHQGKIPQQSDTFLALKGVGPYTQAAVMSIAFDLPLATVDGNVFRVWSRLNDDTRDTALQSTRKAYEQELVPYVTEQAGDFNQAMMELGALVCTPKAPLCLFCPVQIHCESFQQGTVLERPVKTKKLKKKTVVFDVYVIQNHSGDYLIEQRTVSLLKGMWQFPMFENETSYEDKLNVLGIKQLNTIQENVVQMKHQFTHLTWILNVHLAKIDPSEEADIVKGRQWMAAEDKTQYSFPVSMTQIFNAVRQADN